MPCYTAPPTHSEKEIVRLNDLVDEIDSAPRTKQSFCGMVRPRLSIQALTQQLCEWCKANDPKTRSLEFQIWWRDHQIEDARHEREDIR